ncbi:uncharacterized protein LOC119335822 [Triticum dicoccoides]|uniref:uncharacterized protein LOC119335822 n=1 Tax=Triticum dicoccoides TaxID=85692 RepID=UPI00189107B3|nr:uncharacterized protein LOC119335822 [Triticum dicoccoides]
MECARREDGRRGEARSRSSSCARASRLLAPLRRPLATRRRGRPQAATVAPPRALPEAPATPRRRPPQPRLASPCEQTASPPAAKATVLELTGADRMRLISEVFAVLADISCSIVDARAWSHRGRLACLVYLRDEDVAAAGVERIEARLAPLLRGDSEASGHQNFCSQGPLFHPPSPRSEREILRFRLPSEEPPPERNDGAWMSMWKVRTCTRR